MNNTPLIIEKLVTAKLARLYLEDQMTVEEFINAIVLVKGDRVQ